VLDMSNREVAQAQAALVSRGESAVAGAAALLVEVTLPSSLAPGQYGLEVSAPSMNPDVPLWGFTRFLIADKKSLGKTPIWVRYTAPAAQSEGVPPAVAFQGKGGRVKASPRIKAAYRSALRSLAADPAAAQAAVTELETSSLPTGSVREWEALVLSETDVAKELAVSQRESVLCLALLHLELQREYTRSKSYLVEVHARRMVEEFAVLYTERGGDAQTKAMAANVLASLAGNLQQPGTWGTSERLFRRALELDPNNAAALMAMAANMERVGQYERAVVYLKTLLEARPEDAEGRLRLAINLQRVGSQEKASELLNACTSEGNPDWVRAVAYQQIAAALLGAGSYEQADRLLGKALAILPGDEGLTMQLVYTLDRLHRPVDARALAKEVGARAGKVDTSPRFRYADRPLDDLIRVEETLSASTPAAREALAAALGEAGKGSRGGQR
jgi:tetratricopeptide (TPR) repeat protein